LALASSLENATTLKIQTTALSPTVRSYTGYYSLTGPTSTIDLNIGTVSEYSSYYLIEVTSTDNITLQSQGYVVNDPYPVVIPVQNNTAINIDPFIVGNFAISDCNPLINNATTDDRSIIYYDVDYSNDSITPVNFDAIIAGTALKAELQDYNYFARRSIIPRYQGSRSTSDGFNLNTVEGGLGALPNVEQDRAYFAYFNWVGGTAPEWGNGLEDRSALSIRYFVNENGDVIEPTNDNNGVNLGICRQTFTEGETGVLSFDDENGTSSGFSNLLGEQTIFKSGKKIIPIIYSQTESISDTTTGGYTGSITFVQGDQNESTVDDYRLTAYANAQLVTGTGTLTFTTPTVLGDEASFSSNVYAPTSSPSTSTPQTTITIRAEVNSIITSNNGSSATFQIQRNRNGAGWVGVGNIGSIVPGYTNSTSMVFTDATALSTDDYRIQILSYNPPSFGPGINIGTNSYFKVTQTPPPNIGPVGPDAPSPSGTNYWTKLGTTTNQFRTNALTAVLGQKQQDISGSGFSAITTDFNLEVGDEIRFQGTETQTYKITAIDVATNPSYVGALVYTVDRNITLTNTEMNWFLVRRYVDTPSEIIIEADKPAGGTSPGFFMPLYSTKGIEDNFDRIIQDLKTDQLI